ERRARAHREREEPDERRQAVGDQLAGVALEDLLRRREEQRKYVRRQERERRRQRGDERDDEREAMHAPQAAPDAVGILRAREREGLAEPDEPFLVHAAARLRPPDHRQRAAPNDAREGRDGQHRQPRRRLDRARERGGGRAHEVRRAFAQRDFGGGHGYSGSC